MKSKNIFFSIFIKSLLILNVLFSGAAFAQLIAITPITPFPAQVPVSSSATASYAVTNLASKINITVVDQSKFPAGSGLFISSSTCRAPLSPKQSCTINVGLKAPAVPQVISGLLRERAAPSLDGVEYPIVVTITKNVVSQFIVTPSGGVGGAISPSTPQTVNAGSSIVFTATPNSGFEINQWLLDGVVVQTGGTTYTLSNINANHTVQVTFSVPALAIAMAAGRRSGPNAPIIAATTDGGVTWEMKTIGGSPSSTSFQTPGTSSSCTGTGSTAACIAVGGTISVRPVLILSQDGAQTWNNFDLSSIVPAGILAAAASTGNGGTAILVAGGELSGAPDTPLIIASTDGGTTWQQKTIGGTAPIPGFSTFTSAGCTGTFCIAAGTNTNGSIPFFAQSTDGANTWTYQSTNPFGSSGSLYDSSCTGNTICVIVGSSNSGNATAIGVTTDSGTTWNYAPTDGTTPGQLNSVSCMGSGSNATCVAVGGTASTSPPSNSIILVSIDSGQNWTPKSIQGVPSSGILSTASCTQTSTGSVCVVAGNNAGAPLLAVSTDGGNTWTSKTVANMPAAASFNSSSCTPNGATALCTATADSVTGNQLALATSTDGGNTWVLQDSISGLPASGTFLTTAGTSSSGSFTATKIKKAQELLEPFFNR